LEHNMADSIYNYSKTPVALDSLTQQIQNASLATALDYVTGITLFGAALTISFIAPLSDADKTTLDAVVAAHDGTPLPQNSVQNVNVNNSPIVTTQFELRNKTLKLASASGTVGGDGTVTVSLLVPGTANPTGDITLAGRWISSGTAFFDVATAGDMVTSVHFVDIDNISGAGANTVIGSYTDDVMPSGNQGWYIPPLKGWIQADAIGGYGFAPAGYYLVISAKKGGGLTTGTFYINFEWANEGS